MKGTAETKVEKPDSSLLDTIKKIIDDYRPVMIKAKEEDPAFDKETGRAILKIAGEIESIVMAIIKREEELELTESDHGELTHYLVQRSLNTRSALIGIFERSKMVRSKIAAKSAEEALLMSIKGYSTIIQEKLARFGVIETEELEKIAEKTETGKVVLSNREKFINIDGLCPQRKCVSTEISYRIFLYLAANEGERPICARQIVRVLGIEHERYREFNVSRKRELPTNIVVSAIKKIMKSRESDPDFLRGIELLIEVLTQNEANAPSGGKKKASHYALVQKDT